MVIEIVGAYVAVKRGRATINQVPSTLREWFDLVPESQDFDELLAQCLGGPMSDVIEDWIQNSALAHIIGWKRNAEALNVDPEDRVVQAGVDATRWLVDRFTRTMLDDWSRSSLDWELAYLLEPEATARAVGVVAPLISERPVSESMVMCAIARRARERSLSDEVFGGMVPGELMENVIALALRGERLAALELVRKALEYSPSQMEFEQAVAFLIIPDNPTEALRRLASMHGRRGAPEKLLTACSAMCNVRLGLDAETLDDLRDLSTDSDERRFWLWSAESLTVDEPLLQQNSLADWAITLLGLLEG